MAERPQIDRIEHFIALGESQYLEFKERLVSEEQVARSLVAFANAEGGLLLIGVREGSDGPTVVGLGETLAAVTVQRLRKMASSLIPAPVPVGTVEVAGRTVVYASVNTIPEHLKPISTAQGVAYRRESDRNVVVQAPVLLEADRPGVWRVFVAMSFRTEEEPALVDYYEAMQRAAAQVGSDRIQLFQMREVPGNFEISQAIMDEIRGCDALLADFTLNPRNVYFEAGFARGCQIPVIQTALRDTPLEFDVQNWRTTFYRNATELEARLYPVLVDLVSSPPPSA